MKKHGIQKTAAELIVLLLLAGCAASPPSESGFETIIPASKETESITTTNAVISTEETENALLTTEPLTEDASTEVPETDQPQLVIESTTPAPETSESAVPETSKPTEPAPPQPTEPAPTQPKPSEPAPTQPKPTEPAPTEPAPTEPKPTETTHRHSWGSWTQTTVPTCGSTGVETRTCSGCGEKETRSIAATGAHTWKETSPTCTADGSKACTVCGAKETIPALGHDWVHHEEEGHWQLIVTCYCGAQFNSESEWYAHATASPDLDYADEHAGYEAHEVWTVDKPARDVCSRCGATR